MTATLTQQQIESNSQKVRIVRIPDPKFDASVAWLYKNADPKWSRYYMHIDNLVLRSGVYHVIKIGQPGQPIAYIFDATTVYRD